jgi:hypothetical protein
MVYFPIKQWLTCERAEMDEDAMMFAVAEEAHNEMLIAGLKTRSIPNLQILDSRRKDKSMSRAASIIRFINVQCNIAPSASACCDL